jgi:hypothetical protein
MTSRDLVESGCKFCNKSQNAWFSPSMKSRLFDHGRLFSVTLIAISFALAIQSPRELVAAGKGDEPLRIEAPELAHLNFDLSTGGLPLAPGLETFSVCRADREHPDTAEGRGWTYQHHPDLAAWHGRLYVGWNTCERNEDVWPSRELLVPPPRQDVVQARRDVSTGRLHATAHVFFSRPKRADAQPVIIAVFRNGTMTAHGKTTPFGWSSA